MTLTKEEEPADLCVVTKYISDDETSNGYLRDATALMYMGTETYNSLGILLIFLRSPLGGVDTVTFPLHSRACSQLKYPFRQRPLY